MANTHYAIISFSGDPAGEHDDPELRGAAPSLTLIAAGPEQYCWTALEKWTTKHPLRMREEAEVVYRNSDLVAAQQQAADIYRKTHTTTEGTPE